VDTAEISKRAAQDAQQVTHAVVAQFIASVALAACLFLVDATTAYSGLTGGLIAALANGWFAFKVYTAKGEQPAQVLRVFYLAEINKLLMTGALFVAAFVLLKPVNAAALLAAYFFIHMMPAALGVLSTRKRRNTNESNHVG
jgi:ATP synthase protein I